MIPVVDRDAHRRARKGEKMGNEALDNNDQLKNRQEESGGWSCLPRVFCLWVCKGERGRSLLEKSGRKEQCGLLRAE